MPQREIRVFSCVILGPSIRGYRERPYRPEMRRGKVREGRVFQLREDDPEPR